MWRNFKFIVKGDVMVAARARTLGVCVLRWLKAQYFYL